GRVRRRMPGARLGADLARHYDRARVGRGSRPAAATGARRALGHPVLRAGVHRRRGGRRRARARRDLSGRGKIARMMTALIALAVSYLLGSVVGSLVLGRFRGVDIRTQGSGNAGGTNALRTQGKAFAAAVMVIDVGKGVLAAGPVAVVAAGSPADAAAL